MSIILKGIDIHKQFESARLILERNEKDGTIRVINESSGEYIGSAIQIPKGHGRLIDADALETVFKDMAKCEWNQKASPISWSYAFEDTIEEIDEAPTILEAEE